MDRGPCRSERETAGGGSAGKGIGIPIVPPIAYWRESARTISILAALCCIQYNVLPAALVIDFAPVRIMSSRRLVSVPGDKAMPISTNFSKRAPDTNAMNRVTLSLRE
jgi:hypothetical protein